MFYGAKSGEELFFKENTNFPRKGTELPIFGRKLHLLN